MNSLHKIMYPQCLLNTFIGFQGLLGFWNPNSIFMHMHHANHTTALKIVAFLYSSHAAGKGHGNLRMFPSMDPWQLVECISYSTSMHILIMNLQARHQHMKDIPSYKTQYWIPFGRDNNLVHWILVSRINSMHVYYGW